MIDEHLSSTGVGAPAPFRLHPAAPPGPPARTDDSWSPSAPGRAPMPVVPRDPRVPDTDRVPDAGHLPGATRTGAGAAPPTVVPAGVRGKDRRLVAGAVPGVGGALFAYHRAPDDEWAMSGVYCDVGTTSLPGRSWADADVFTTASGTVVVVSVVDDDDPAGGEVRWMAGEDDGTRFTEVTSGVLDVGDSFHRPRSYWCADGRRLQLGHLRTGPRGAGSTAPALPRELSVVQGQVHTVPARELYGLRRRCTVAPALDGALSFGRPLAVGELVVDAAAASVLRGLTLVSPSGAAFPVPVEAFAGRGGELRLFWDAGLVETFRDGLAGSWTDLGLDQVARLTWSLARPVEAMLTTWELDLPAPRHP